MALVQDIRYAVRTLRRAPLFTATVVVTMGLGLGMIGSAFTVLNAYLLKPIDLPNPRALYSLSWDTETTRRQPFSLSDYEALQPGARRFAALAATQNVTVMQGAVPMLGLLVTGNYFELLGARPARGRLLRSDDALARGGRAVVVLSHQAWRSRYGADPTILGQQILLGGQRFEVVGVTEPHAYLSGQEFVSFWVPLTMAGALPGVDPWSQRDEPSLVVIGRVHQGVNAASLRAWFELWLRQRDPEPEAAPIAVHVDSLATRLPLGGVTLTLFVFIMSAFGLVLLVASANVTNLMLARALARQGEIAVRLSLGASRWRVMRQLIVESLVLAVPAAAAGLGLIVVTARVFPAAILATFPTGAGPVDSILVPLEPDWRVMAFLAVAAMLSAVLIALAPAVRLAGLRLSQVSRGEVSSDVRGGRLRSGLVAVQIGSCALFLVGAVGLLNESSRLANPTLNLSYDRVSLITIDSQMRVAVARRLASEAMVEQVAVSWKPPLANGSLPTTRVTASTTNLALNAGYTAVSPGYFTMFDIRVVRGRAFTPAEAAAGSPVALVSEATAAALWPGLDPLGQTLDLAAASSGRAGRRPPGDRVRVVGVTEDVATGSILDGIDASCVYFPTDLQTAGDMSLLVKARADDDEALRAAVTAAVKTVAPETSFRVVPMRTVVGGAAWMFRLFSTVASLLGVVGLLFAYSGTYAVVSFMVAQRRREIGVRMALGASASQIVWAMLTRASRAALLGLAAGLVVAAGLVRLIHGASRLVPDFGLQPFVAGAAIVLAATAVAALAPMRVAARTDPASALRAD